MTIRTHVLAATAAIGSLAAPAAAQYYPQPQQTYPQQQYQQQYPQQQYQQGYGQQGYSQNPIEQIINGLLGNRYNVTDRQAVSRCANAAVSQAQAQYGGGYGYGNGYGQQYGQGYGQQNAYAYNRMAGMRVTSITDVQRRGNGLRVSGTLGSGAGYGNGYQGQGYNRGESYEGESYEGQGYQREGYNRGYAASSLSFRCNVDYSGAVTGVRVGRNNGYRG
jgi:hypothetical protein